MGPGSVLLEAKSLCMETDLDRKRLGFRGPGQVTEKQRGSEGMQAARRAARATLALALKSQTQGGRVLFGFQSEIRDAGVLAGSLGGSSCSHDGGGRC